MSASRVPGHGSVEHSRHVFTLLALAVGIAIGATAIVYGEGDDSPGLQGLGALIVVCMIALGVKAVRSKRRRDVQTRPNSHRREDTDMPD